MHQVIMATRPALGLLLPRKSKLWVTQGREIQPGATKVSLRVRRDFRPANRAACQIKSLL